MSIQKLWYAILEVRIETGGHSWFTGMLLMVMGSDSLIVQCYTNHDCFAAKLNQQKVGTIKSLNLCIEIIGCSSPKRFV
jgi:hypothetical protein